MKGKFKVLSLLLSLVMVFSLAFNVKAEDVNPPVRISYEIDGEAYEDGYADLAMITFNVETDEGVEISKIDLYEDGELYEEDIDIEDAFDLAYKPETTFQLKVTATDGNVYESELVTIKVYEVTDYDDDDEDEEDDYLFIHNWDFENMEIQEPDDETDGYVRICCLDEGCEEYLQLGITVYDIIKGDNSVFNLNEPKDLTFTVDGDGLLVGAVIGEDMLTEDDYLDNYNGSVTIYKETLKKLDVGTYDIDVVINDVELLNTSAANSILKFLEEPEENIIAILITSNRNLVINTIVSRCQVIRYYVKESFDFAAASCGFRKVTFFRIINKP